MDASMVTGSETSVAQRQQMVRWHQHGWTYATIAAHLGCSRWTVGRWVRAHARGGDTALVSPGHRPHTPHPQLTAPTVQARIRTIRQTHPGWGARLIRRQLDLDGVPTPPSEGTIQHWLHRQGFPLVRPPRQKPLGWTTAPPPATAAVWQIDFKQKGGPGT
jgi:transposase